MPRRAHGKAPHSSQEVIAHGPRTPLPSGWPVSRVQVRLPALWIRPSRARVHAQVYTPRMQAPEEGTLLDSVRFGPEREMQRRVLERFGIASAAAKIPEEAQVELDRGLRTERAKHCHVTRRTAPGIFRAVDEAQDRLSLPQEVELLIDANESINAFALPSPMGTSVPVIVLTSGAIKSLSEVQLRCVIGHELGHFAYGHTEFSRLLGLVYRSEPTPDLLDARLRVLSRLQEFSADRAGALAVDRDLLVAAETELRVATGLGPEHVQLDLGSYVEEVRRIEAFEIPNLLFEESHPLLPIRLRALQLFCEGRGEDEEVLRLARLMDFEATRPEGIHHRNLLLAGGLIAAHIDGEVELDDDERQHLVELILPFTDDPEAELARIETLDQAMALFEEATAWVAENSGPERYELFAKLMNITLRDGNVNPGENKFLADAGGRLGIPSAWINAQLLAHDERSARTTCPPRSFGLRPRST